MVFWRPRFRATTMVEYEFSGFGLCGYGVLSESFAVAGIDGQLPASAAGDDGGADEAG